MANAPFPIPPGRRRQLPASGSQIASGPHTCSRGTCWRGLGLKSPETRRATGFDEFLAALEKETVAFGEPVVYVHGDTHIFRVDKPLFGSTSRRTIENFTRVATIGYPDTHWVRAIVDPKETNVFSFRLEIVEANRVKH